MKDPLYLLDGYGTIYRAYFAFIRNPMRNARGENASAVFGFCRILLSLFKTYEPRYFVVVMDPQGKTFRHAKYPQYKATRDATPDDLHAQIPVISNILQALGVPTAVIPEYEADDVIAALAMQCRKNNRECRIISSDKDLLQLVGEHVSVIRFAKSKAELLDSQAVYEEKGVYPHQILDYLSLIGDSADNVPGVKGIGEKTAAALLGAYGTLKSVYDNIEQISSKSQREKLEAGRENAWLSRDLIQLAYDAPVSKNAEEYTPVTLNWHDAVPILLDQGMHALVKELSVNGETQNTTQELSPPRSQQSAAHISAKKAAQSNAVQPAHVSSTSEYAHIGPRQLAEDTLTEQQLHDFAQQGAYTCITTLQELDSLLDTIYEAGIFAFDSESDNINAIDAKPIGFSFSVHPREGCYLPLHSPNSKTLPEHEVQKRLAALFTHKSLRVIGQNFKYDLKILRGWGIHATLPTFDTMVAAWLINTNANTYNMDKLARDYFHYETIHFADLFPPKQEKNFTNVPIEKATLYAAEDADVTFRLYFLFTQLLEKWGLYPLFEELEMPLIPVLTDMELEGIAVDNTLLLQYSQELTEQIRIVQQKIFALAGYEFNIASTQQLQRILFQERGLTPIKKTKTGYSTDIHVLQALAAKDEIPRHILHYRMLTKLQSTYVDALPKMINTQTGRIHTVFNLCGTATGRISSNDPNLQNIPIRNEEGRRIRSAFIPREGSIFISADYTQIELVVLAHLSQDKSLCTAFNNNEDVHRKTASMIFGIEPQDVTSEQRRIAKTINFGVMYGMSGFRLSNELGIPRKEADHFIERYFATYNGVRQFIEATITQAQQEGKVYTLLGRPRLLPDINNRNQHIRAAAERIAVNSPIQGTAADIMKKALLQVSQKLSEHNLKARLLLQVHDELIAECPQEEAETLSSIMRDTMSSAAALSVPLRVTVEMGRSWGDLHV